MRLHLAHRSYRKQLMKNSQLPQPRTHLKTNITALYIFSVILARQLTYYSIQPTRHPREGKRTLFTIFRRRHTYIHNCMELISVSIYTKKTATMSNYSDIFLVLRHRKVCCRKSQTNTSPRNVRNT